MKQIFISTIISFISITLFAQQEFGLHFTERLIQSNQTNPAFMSPYKFTLMLPSINAGYNNSGFQLKDFFRDDGNQLQLNPTVALAEMKADGNLFQTHLNISALSLSFQLKDFQFTLFHNINVDSYWDYPRDLIGLLWQGNAPYVGETVEVAPSLDLWAYHEYGLGFATKLNEQLTVGINLKVLSGVFSIHTQKANASVYTAPEHYQLTVETDVVYQTGGLNDFLDDTDDLIAYENTGTYFLNRNNGVALDFGINYKLNEKISLALSAVDIGSITWREAVRQQTSQGTYSFDGIDVNLFEDDEEFDFDEVRDTLEEIFDFQETASSFKTSLPPRFYLSGTMAVTESLKFGALAYAELYNKELRPAFALSVQKHFGEILSLGAVGSIRTTGSSGIGANMTVRVAGIQLYALCDNIIPLFDVTNGRSTNFRVGLNLAFKNFLKKKPKEIEEPIEEKPKEYYPRPEKF